MSIGAISITAVVNSATKRISVSKCASFGQLVTWSIVSSGNDAANLILIAYRGSTVVAVCQGMTGTTILAYGTMDLNTTELAAVMEDVPDGEVRSLNLILFNSSTLEMVARGILNVLGSDAYSATTPTGAIIVQSDGLSFETIDGVEYFVLKRGNVVWKRFPAPGATPNE